MNDENGFASVAGICWMSILLLIGGTLFVVNQTERLSVERFQYGQKMQYAADDGARIGISMIEKNPTLQNSILANGNETVIHSYTDDNAEVIIYAKKINSKIAILSISKRINCIDTDIVKGRSIVYMKKKDENTYVTDHWEH